MLQRIYLRERGRLGRLSTGLGGGSDAEDALQDLWLGLARTEGAVGPEIRNPRAYLSRMVANAVTGYLRRGHRRDALQQELAEILNGEDGVSAERVLAGRQAVAAVRDALAALPARTREVFLMSRLDGITHREIALRLSISEQTVHYHIRRALDHLAPLRAVIYDPPGS